MLIKIFDTIKKKKNSRLTQKKIKKKKISIEQTGGLPGRQMTKSLMGIRNLLLQISVETKTPGAIPPRAAVIGLDFAGAYDRVDRGFLYKAMECFGFPTATLRWIQTLYETSVARMILNVKCW